MFQLNAMEFSLRLEHRHEDARREGRDGDVRKQVVDVGELPGSGPLR